MKDSALAEIPLSEGPLPRILYAACPLCNSTKFRPHAYADCSKHQLYVPQIPAKIQWMRCDDCEHVFTDGYFSEVQNAALFAKAQPNQLPGHNIEQGRALAGRIVERVIGQLMFPHEARARPRWLDVGFGDGSLLMAAQEFGFEPVGLDLRVQAVDKLKAFGIECHASAIEEFEPAKPFQVLSMADVLEHIPYPKASLSIANALLEREGILFLSCPNMDTVAWRDATAKNANPYWLEVEHFHNFTRKRLYDLLAECGFAPIQYSVSERYRMGCEIIARKA